MQKTTSLPEAPAVAATSAASTSSWLSGANPLFRLPGNAPFPQQPQTPTLCPSPWKILLPAATSPCPCPRRAFPTVPPGEADALPAPIFPKKRRLFFRHSCLKKTHCSPTQYPLSRRIPARRSRKPCIFRKTLRGCRPFAVPLPRRAFPAEPPRPITESAGSLPPSHAPGASPKRKLRRQMPQFRCLPGLSGAGSRQARENAPHSFPHAAKAAKKRRPAQKTQTV